MTAEYRFPILVRIVVGLSLCAITSWAQQATGTITGTISDPQNAVVPGATVEIRNVGTNAGFETRSNETGFYNAPNFPVGEYTITASANGFKKAIRTGVNLQVNQNAQVNITLDVGQVAETVEVQAEALLVDTGSATLGAVIENRRVRDLPLNGRNALSLTLLNAGVISNAGPTNSGFGDRGVQISSLSINGSPSSMNAQMLDGNNNILSYVGEVGVPPAVDVTLGNIGRTLPDVRTPGTVNFDLSLIKDTRISERVNLQFRAESFNFLNHVNLGRPNVTFSPGANGKNANANVGTINSARDARINQLALKLIF